MKSLACFLALACLLARPLHSQTNVTAADDVCRQHADVPLPAEAQQVSTPKTWPECESYKFYSGIGRAVDYDAARKCAWKERQATQAGLEPRYTVASVFGGSAMLTVLYANGEGITQDYELAMRFACEAGGADAEIHIRLAHLASLRSKGSASSPKFSFCDDITSGFMQGFCAAYSSELADQKRANDLTSITERFSESERAAFSLLSRAQEAYASEHAKGEIDLAGTARAMYQIDAQDTLREDFLAALQAFEAGRFPTGSQHSYAEADALLNTAYRKALSDAEKHKSDYGAVQPAGIRTAQRAWLKYRDAWVKFAKLRYPSVPEEAWLTLLTKDRTSILDGSFCDMDAVDGPCAQQGDSWKPSPLP